MGGENPQVTWAKPHSPTLIPDLRLLNFLCQGCLGLLLARNHGLGMPPWTADELCPLVRSWRQKTDVCFWRVQFLKGIWCVGDQAQ